MSDTKRKGVLVAAVIWVVVLGVVAVAYKYLVSPYLEGTLVGATSSESQYKHTVRLAADGFSGYAILRSPAMQSQLKADGIRLEIVDDQADYVQRLADLKKGKTQMAVFTVDALLAATARSGDDPASIVMVIDETTGADAIVAYESAVPNLLALDHPEARIVATPASPSEFLARTMIATLSLPSLPEDWLEEADGAEDAYKRFRAAKKKGKATAYVLWEPFVSKALKIPGAHVLLDSSKMKGYIVDVLVARRQFLAENPDLVQRIVEAHMRALYSYQQRAGGLVQLVLDDAKAGGQPLSKAEAQKLVSGIQWKNTLENYVHVGLAPSTAGSGSQNLEDIIDKIADVLVKTGVLEASAVEDAAQLFYDGTMAALQGADFHPGKKLDILEGVGPGTDDLAAARATAALPSLNPKQWEALTTVAAMRVAPLEFRRGTAEISEFSRSDLDALGTRFNSWPTYYMRVVGHARAEGDAKANLRLAQARADATRDYLVAQGVAESRLKAEAAPTASAEAAVSFVLGQKPY